MTDQTSLTGRSQHFDKSIDARAELAVCDQSMEAESNDLSGLEALWRAVAEQTDYLTAAGGQLQFFADRQAELRRVLVDARQQLVVDKQKPQPLHAAMEALQRQTALVEERTAWAQRLDEEVSRHVGTIRELQTALEDRTAWARQLEEEVSRHVGTIRELQAALEDRTAWARRLEEEVSRHVGTIRELQAALEDRTAWARRLEEEVSRHVGTIRELQAAPKEPSVAAPGRFSSFRAWLGRT